MNEAGGQRKDHDKVTKFLEGVERFSTRKRIRGMIALADESRHFPLHAVSDDYNTRSVTFNLPGNMMELDMYGNPTLKSIFWQFSPIIIYHLSNPIPRDGSYLLFNFRKLITERMFSVIGTSIRVQVEPAYYRSDTPLSNISVTMRLAKATRKTVYTAIDFRTSDKETKLLSAVCLLGFFNMTNRSLLELSHDLLGNLPTPSPDIILDFSQMELVEPPPGAFVHTRIVTWGNIEFHGHMTYHWYHQYAIDAVALAIESPGSERSWTISDVNLAAGVKQVHVKYMKEVLHADQLKICVWQDDVRGDTAMCRMERNDQLIAMISITFYTEKRDS